MIRRSTLPDVGPLVYDLPRVQGNVLSVRGKVMDVLTSLTTPCYAGGSSRASHEVPTISESRSNPYGCDDNIYFAIVKSLCFGLNLFGSSLTNHIIDQKMDISKLLRTRLSCWIADNEDFQVGGKGLPSWTRETYGDILRTNLYLLRDSPFVTNLLIQSLGLSPEDGARLITPSDDVLRFYKEADDGLYTFSAAQMRLTITEQGLIGVAMSEASQGDTLVRFEGCERLIVVREAIRNNDRWVVVGEGWLCTDHTRFSEDESELRWFDIV
ncbi:hypothetical protein HZ326_6565 [Fusarium oxysporum f. sp. albedinis]|nr:hypothetical protein HZ326_6565 [Fusarium oxysporum f. sp. albedinis]